MLGLKLRRLHAACVPWLLPWDASGIGRAEGGALHGGGDLRTWCWGKMRRLKSGKG